MITCNSSKDTKSNDNVDDFGTELTGNTANLTIRFDDQDHNAVTYEGVGKLFFRIYGVYCSSHKDAGQHLIRSHNVRSWHYSCSRCGKIYERLTQVSCHFSSCTGQLQAANTDLATTETNQCGPCSASFSSKHGLILHQKARHPSLIFDQLEARNREGCRGRTYEQAELVLLAQAELKLHEACCLPNKTLADAGIVARTAEQIRQIRKLERYRTTLSEL